MISTAASPCARGKSSRGTSPTGAVVGASRRTTTRPARRSSPSGASWNFGQYSDAKADALIKLTNTSSSLQSLYNYQNYLSLQLPDIWQVNPALQLTEIGKNVCGVVPQNTLWRWTAEFSYLCKPGK